MIDDNLNEKQTEMIKTHLIARGIKSKTVINTMLKVKRENFVKKDLKSNSYDDNPLPIGNNQTISQPYMVALMTENLELEESDIVLEIGTGSGYQTAILSELAKEVYSIERILELHDIAKTRLESLNYKNVHTKWDDGYLGWEAKKFDKIIVTASANEIPQSLIDQLKIGGILVIPVDISSISVLYKIVKLSENEISKNNICYCSFVPMLEDKIDS